MSYYYQRPTRVRKDEGLTRKVYMYLRGDVCDMTDEEIEKRGLLKAGAIGKGKPDMKGYETKIVVPEKDGSQVSKGVINIRAIDDISYIEGTKEKKIKKGKTSFVTEDLALQLLGSGKAEKV